MKKVLAVLLSVICICSVFAVCANAAVDPVISPEKVVKIISGVKGDTNGGTINPPTNTYTPGEDVTFYITPNAGYRIKQVWVNGVAIGPVTEYTFYNIQADSTIFVEFEKESETTTGKETTKPTKKNGKKTSPDTGANLDTVVLSVLGAMFVGSTAAVLVAKKSRKEEY
ncbi:MAG: hypothetical protein IJJ41_10160 [Clostridia bacterium]|nr:hypothetical protein [Clostridia bacterium]